MDSSRKTIIATIKKLKKDWMAMNRKYIEKINKLTVKYGYSYQNDRPQDAGENIVYCWCQNETWFPGNTTPGDGELYLFDKKGETLPEWEKRSRANASIKKELVKTITEMLKAWKLENKKFAEKISKATVAGNWSYCDDTPRSAGKQIVSDWLQDNIWYPGELYQFSKESTEEQPIKEEVEPSDVGENGFVEYAFKPKTLDVDTVLEILNKFKKEHGNTGVVVWYNNPDNKYRISYSPSRNVVCFWAMKHFG